MSLLLSIANTNRGYCHVVLIARMLENLVEAGVHCLGLLGWLMLRHMQA